MTEEAIWKWGGGGGGGGLWKRKGHLRELHSGTLPVSETLPGRAPCFLGFLVYDCNIYTQRNTITVTNSGLHYNLMLTFASLLKEHPADNSSYYSGY